MTYVIDDVYHEVDSTVKWKPRKIIDRVPVGYNGKFVVALQQGIYVVVATPGSHTNHNYRDAIMGGGIIQKQEVTTISGGSTTYGGFDKEFMQSQFPTWKVQSATTYTNDVRFEQLKIIFPNAAITTKALQQGQYKNAEIVPQFFYEGVEKRAYYKCNRVRQKLQCVICNYVRESSLRLHVSQQAIRDAFVQVGGADCMPHSCKSKKYAIETVLQYARKHTTLKVVVSALKQVFHYTDLTVYSLIQLASYRGVRVVDDYDGKRLTMQPHIPNSILPQDMKESPIAYLKWIFKAQIVGDVMMGDEKELKINVTSEYDPYYKVVFPVDMDQQNMIKHEIGYDFIVEPRCFVDKSFQVDSDLITQGYYLLRERTIRCDGDVLTLDHDIFDEDYIEDKYKKKKHKILLHRLLWFQWNVVW